MRLGPLYRICRHLSGCPGPAAGPPVRRAQPGAGVAARQFAISSASRERAQRLQHLGLASGFLGTVELRAAVGPVHTLGAGQGIGLAHRRVVEGGIGRDAGDEQVAARRAQGPGAGPNVLRTVAAGIDHGVPRPRPLRRPPQQGRHIDAAVPRQHPHPGGPDGAGAAPVQHRDLMAAIQRHPQRRRPQKHAAAENQDAHRAVPIRSASTGTAADKAVNRACDEVMAAPATAKRA